MMYNIYVHKRRRIKVTPKLHWGIETWNGVVRLVSFTWLKRSFIFRWWKGRL